ncbi:hypothetical protein V6N13_140787 [Hibiscus sabdariffa]
MSYNNDEGIPEEAENLDTLYALTRQGKTEVNWAERHAAWVKRWAQRRCVQPLREPMRPDRTVANRYIQWFYENGKPFILARRSALELYQGLVQRDHDNNVAVGLLVPLLEVDK